MYANTCDIGLMIRDMIEGQEFTLYGEEKEEIGNLEKLGYANVETVDCSDPNNLILVLNNGQQFTVRIFAGT